MENEKHFYLFRGLIREKEHWGRFPTLLQETDPNSRVTALDLPGAGVWCNQQAPLSVREMVEEMRREFLKTLQPGEERHLIAISLGGMIALEWQQRYPEDFTSLTLINTSSGGDSPMFHRLRPGAFLHLLKVPFLKNREKERHILELVSNNPLVFQETLNNWERIIQERPVSLKNSLRQLCAAALWRPDKVSPLVPIFLLASTQDRMVNVECSRKLAKKWNAPIWEHPTGGHDLPVDDPKWVSERIKEIIAGL